MQMITMKCPECGATMSLEQGRRECFCQYCGTKLFVDDGSTSYTYRKIDEARIKEADIDKEIELKRLENESIKMKFKIGSFLAVALIGILFSVLPSIDYGFHDVAGVGYIILLALPIMWIVVWRSQKNDS